MKLFVSVTILLISTIVYSTKCKNPALKCIELCCALTQFYEDTYQYCEDIPQDAKAWWHVLLRDNKTVEFVEYGVCGLSHDSFIPSCHSPFFHIQSKEFVLKRWLDVPCDRLDEPVFVWPIGVLVGIGVLPFCLPIMVVYTCKKGLKETFSFKLVAWYLASTVIYLLTETTAGITELMSTELLDILKDFFFISTCLWLNVIGFQIWSSFKEANASDSADKNHWRFIWYSIYVWGIAATITSLDHMLSGQWNFLLCVNLKRVLAVYNMVTFIILSVNICITRCRVINLTNEAHYKRQLVYIICRLCLMMGIPRMTIIFSGMYDHIDFLFSYSLSVLEPFVIFIVLVLKPKNVFNWISCCSKKSEKISNAAKTENTNTESDEYA